MANFFLDTKKIEKIYKNERNTLNYYKNTIGKHYACIHPLQDGPFKLYEIYMPFSFIVDPILHIGKFLINLLRLIPAAIESVLGGVFKVKGCKNDVLGNVIAAMFFNFLNIIVSPIVGLCRLLVATPYAMLTTVAPEEYTGTMCTNMDARANNGLHQAEKNHIDNKFDIFNDDQNEYQSNYTTSTLSW